MDSVWRRRMPLIGAGLAAGGLICLGLAVCAWAAAQYYRAADYPGASLVAEHNLYHVFPTLDLRRDTSYRSTAEFLRLYHWYSRQFGLGPEARAESACITMQRAETVVFLRWETVVTLCDASPQRLIFVTRAYSLRWP